MSLTTLVEQGSSNPLYLISAALLLGAMHGLEPGHSKTMMAAFIIAVRGTISQAVILGISAMLSHTAIVWILALLALSYGDKLIAEELEPWFMVVSGIIIIGIAIWMLLRNIYLGKKSHHHHHHDQHHDHHHSHTHEHHGEHKHEHDHLDGHARKHARDIEEKFSSGKASTGQVIWFGLTGGLIPCPAAVSVLLICLHIKQLWLGVVLVGAFSVGLALTLVAVGVATAWGLSVVRRKTSRLDALFAAAPFVSALLIGIIGIIMVFSGLHHFPAHVH